MSLAGASTLAVGVLLGCSRPTERADAAQQRPTSADDGRQRWRLRPSSARLGRLEWGVDGAFAMSCYRHQIGGESLDRHVDIVRNGKIEQVVDLGDRSIQASHSVGDASGMAWSPSGDGLALLLDRQEVMLVDTRTGKKITAFTSPAPPIPDGLPDYYKKGHQAQHGLSGDVVWPTSDRIVRVAPHFIAVYSLAGDRLTELVVGTVASAGESR